MHFERRLSDLTVSALSMGRPSDDDLSRVPPHFKLSPRALHPPKITQPPSQIGLILRLRDLIKIFEAFHGFSGHANLGQRMLFVRTLGTLCLILSGLVFSFD